MKKTYITPQTQVEFAQAETMLAASIRNIEGDANIGLNNGPAPTKPMSKATTTLANLSSIDSHQLTVVFQN